MVAEANRLLEENKTIWANLFWRVDRDRFRLDAKVLCLESGEILSLLGTIGKKNRSFVLLYQNTPIRKYTVHSYHRDPVTREQIRGPHKHTWDDQWEDKRAYIPNDIRMGNPNEELMDFLGECNITLKGTYTPRMFPASGQEGGG